MGSALTLEMETEGEEKTRRRDRRVEEERNETRRTFGAVSHSEALKGISEQKKEISEDIMREEEEVKEETHPTTNHHLSLLTLPIGGSLPL